MARPILYSDPTEADLHECYEKDSQFDYSRFTVQPAVENSQEDDSDATQPLY